MASLTKFVNDLSTRTSFPLAAPAKHKGPTTTHCCACDRPYFDSDVMIVDGYGPVCANCSADIVAKVLV